MSDPPPPRALARLAPLALAVLGIVLARVVARVALQDVPHVMDEIAYTLQARTFAMGHLSEAPHLPRAAFAMWFVDDRTRFFSIFPPGWPVVLSLGYRVGLASWVNPLLHGITTLVLARAAGRLAGPRAATLTAALYGLSPQAILLAASFMSHTLVGLTTAVVLATGLRMIDKAGSTPPRLALVAAGAAVGLTATTRPLCAVVLAVVLGLFTLIALRRGTLRLPHVAVLVTPALLFLAALGAYNAHLTGSPLRFPQTAFFDGHAPPVDIPLFTYHPGCNQLGFGPGHGCEAGAAGNTHSLKNALSNLGDNLTAWLWLAGGGPLAFALAIVGAAYAKPGERAGRLVTFAAIPLTLVLYGLYWYAGTCYGARFYHVALPALLVLAAFGLERLARWRSNWFRATITLVLLWNGFFGVRAASEVSRSYWGTDARFARLAAGWTDARALVLVAFDDEDLGGHHDLTTFMRDVIWLKNIRALGALAANDPDLGGPVIFARYHPGLVRELRERFPDRKLHVYLLGVKQPDRLMPYESTGLPALEPGAARPVDNFDGFVVPPLAWDRP